MSSNNFDATIDLAPRPSLRALRMLFWLHIAPLALTMATLDPGPAMAALAVALGGSWFWLRRHPVFGFGPKALTRLTWHQDGTWTLHQNDGTAFAAALRGDSLLHARLIVLNFQLQTGGRRTRALVGDELGPEQLRRLRARLAASADAG